jgi:hypothetical protein
MRAIVLYESMFGNTASVACAIAAGLRGEYDVDVRTVNGVSPVPPDSVEADLLVVGAPTHAHGLPSGMSRKALESAAAKRNAEGDALEYDAPGTMRRFVDHLPPGDGRRIACFDTRFDRSPVLTGSAAKTMARRLARRGYEVVDAPASFFVADTEGPLIDGELERATAWGAALAGAVRPVG